MTDRPADRPVTGRPLAVCSWSLQSSGPDGLVRDLAATGLDRVQLGLSPLIQEPGNWSGTIQRLRENGIEIVSGMMAMQGEDYRTLASIARTGGLRPDSTWPANREHAEAVAALASEHGLQLVTFHAGFLPEEAGAERTALLERLAEVAAIFDRRGVQLGLETGQESAADLAGALDTLGCSTLGVNFDPANMILYSMGDPVAAIKLLAPWIRQVHLKDARPPRVAGTWGEEVPIGSGGVEWSSFLAIADRLGVPLVIEREVGESRVADIRHAIAYLEQLS